MFFKCQKEWRLVPSGGGFFWSWVWFSSDGVVLKLKCVFNPYYASWYLQRRMFYECPNKMKSFHRVCIKTLVNSLLSGDFTFIFTGSLHIQGVEHAHFFFPYNLQLKMLQHWSKLLDCWQNMQFSSSVINFWNVYFYSYVSEILLRLQMES